MDINSLHEHNREAYQKVMQHFNEGYQKACVVHATGTGKSMIITAVSGHFERVLILTTNMFTIEQVADTFKKYSPERTVEPTFMIYQALLQRMRDDVDYSQAFDLIVFDEFHHGGAEEWGKAVNWIIEQNLSAKVLGTSATAIRYSDGGRDMGDELFDGNVVSTLSLGEAWARKVLMAPYYIMAVEDSEEFYNDFIRKIEESNLLEDKKVHYREMAKNVKDNYEMEKNAPEIIRKWLPADTRRIIVFSKDIQEAESNLAKVKKWMKKAGFTIAGIYMIHSKRPFEEKKRQMQLFQDDDFVGVKVMVAVDMFNEGIHVPDVDSVFFLRKTQSPTIHLQQMGRCMYRYKENGKRPVVFDFRNNVENTRRAEHTGSFFSDAAKDYDAWNDLEEENQTTQVIREQNKTERVRENFPDGINYTMDYGIMIDRFNVDLSNVDWVANYAEAKGFFDEHGHFPTHTENKRISSWAKGWWLRVGPDKCLEKAKMLSDIGFKYLNKNEFDEKRWMKNFEDAKAFFEVHGHFPTRKENERLYAWAGNWWRKIYLKNPELHQEKADMLITIGFEYKTAEDLNDGKWIDNYKEAETFFKKYGHFPTQKENDRLYVWVWNWWKNTYLKNSELYQEKADMLIAIGFEYKQKKDMFTIIYKEAESFYKEQGYFLTRKENKRVYDWLNTWWKNTYLKNPEKYQAKADMLIAIGFVFVYEKWMKNYEEAKVFFEEHGYFPTGKENKRLYCWAKDWWRNNYLKNPELHQDKADMLKDIGFEYKGKK